MKVYVIILHLNILIIALYANESYSKLSQQVILYKKRFVNLNLLQGPKWKAQIWYLHYDIYRKFFALM